MMPAHQFRVSVSNHVIKKNGRTHAGQNSATCLTGLLKATTVSMGAEDAGKPAIEIRRAVQGSGDVITGRALDGHVLGHELGVNLGLADLLDAEKDLGVRQGLELILLFPGQVVLMVEQMKIFQTIQQLLAIQH